MQRASVAVIHYPESNKQDLRAFTLSLKTERGECYLTFHAASPVPTAIGVREAIRIELDELVGALQQVASSSENLLQVPSEMVQEPK